MSGCLDQFEIRRKFLILWRLVEIINKQGRKEGRKGSFFLECRGGWQEEVGGQLTWPRAPFIEQLALVVWIFITVSIYLIKENLYSGVYKKEPSICQYSCRIRGPRLAGRHANSPRRTVDRSVLDHAHLQARSAEVGL